MAKDDNLLPVPGRYLTTSLKLQYRTSISQIIADNGKVVTLHLQPSTSGCPNCSFLSIGGRSINKYETSNPYPAGPYNRPFPDGRKCPVCLGTHEIKDGRTAEWRATVVKSPKDYDYNAAGLEPTNVVLTKMLSEALSDVTNCLRATIDGRDYTKLSEPYRRGMGNTDDDLAFVEVYWKRVT